MKKGFTLIELLVTVTIIGILSAVAVYGLNNTRQKASDTSHLGSLRELQLALDAYKSINGKYPDAGPVGNSYITGLAPTFMSKLPTDKAQTTSSGYQYTVSSDKKTYCVYVRGTIFKPEVQAELYSTSCTKTWVACKGTDVTSLNTSCPGIVSS